MTQVIAISKEQAAQAFCESFLLAFPTKAAATKDDHEETDTWMRVMDGAPTTGEGCIIEGLNVVEYHSGREPLYLFGVLAKVDQWAELQGWRAELADPGTVKFYREK